MAQRDEFVIEIIANMIMLTRLHENVTEIPFLDVNASYFLLDEKCQYFLLEKNVNNLF